MKLRIKYFAVGFVLFLGIVVTMSACSIGTLEKADVISLFQDNLTTFLQVAESGDFLALESIRGVESVYKSENYVDISCGGAGMGASTHYYGIFYSIEDDLCAIDVAGPRNELTAFENGYLYQQTDGDNRYYVESLGNHYFYYEAHF